MFLNSQVNQLTKLFMGGVIPYKLQTENMHLKAQLKAMTQRAVDAEMELLALKSPKIPDDIRAKMDADRNKCEPPWLNQALNEGNGTYKP